MEIETSNIVLQSSIEESEHMKEVKEFWTQLLLQSSIEESERIKIVRNGSSFFRYNRP